MVITRLKETIDSVLDESISSSDAWNTVALAVRIEFASSACVLRLLKDQKLILAGQAGLPPESATQEINARLGIAAKLIAERKPLAIADVALDPLTAPLYAVTPLKPGAYSFFSYAGASMMVNRTVVGIIGLYESERPRLFTDKELSDLQESGNHIAKTFAAKGYLG